jgi:hypothetical protein
MESKSLPILEPFSAQQQQRKDNMNFPEKLKNTAKGPCSIKILQVNDVYALDNLAYFKTCKDVESKNFDGVVIGALPGDFLSPSALSGLDRGAGMIDCLNHCGIDYASFGKIVFRSLFVIIFSLIVF